MEKISNENMLTKIKRSSPEIIDRSKFLRLDKNERVIPFEKNSKNFKKKLILSTNAYPDTFKIKK